MHSALAEPSTEGLILPPVRFSFLDRVYTMMDRPWGGLWLYLIVINIVSLCAFGLDKWKARRSEKHHEVRRIQEKTLILMAVAGGSAGALLGMKLFRHKTDQRRFSIGIPLILLAQILIPLLFQIYSTAILL